MRSCAVGRRERVQLEEHACQHLADLVVKPARDPQPLGLLCAQRTLAALAALGLESLQHLVERSHQLFDFDAAALDEPLSGPKKIDRPHPLDEPIDRRECMAKQKQVGRQHHDERDAEVDCLHERNRGVNRHRRNREQQRRQRKQRRVDREHPPQQRKP